jgi:hypothetical protein
MKHEEYSDKQSLLHCQTCKRPLALSTKSCIGCGDVDPFLFKKVRMLNLKIKILPWVAGFFALIGIVIIQSRWNSDVDYGFYLNSLMYAAFLIIAPLSEMYASDKKLDALKLELKSQYGLSDDGLNKLLEKTKSIVGI